jgi:hypothetical protein
VNLGVINKLAPYRRLVPDGNSYCEIHGEQPGLNCAACDEKDPSAVAARALPANPSADDFATSVRKEVARQLAEQKAEQKAEAVVA